MIRGALVSENVINLILVVICCSFLFLRGVRIFFRTGLKGELVRTIGILIFLIFYIMDNYKGQVAGFVIFSIGWLVLVTFENEIRREMYRQTSIIERLTGNMPKIQPENVISSKYNKTIGILTGIVCLLIAMTMYKRLMTAGVIEIIFIGVLAMGGILFITFNLFKKSGQHKGR